MNHKRGKPKNSRAGCLMCKCHKANGLKGQFESQTCQEKKAIIDEADQRQDLEDEPLARMEETSPFNE